MSKCVVWLSQTKYITWVSNSWLPFWVELIAQILRHECLNNSRSHEARCPSKDIRDGNNLCRNDITISQFTIILHKPFHWYMFIYILRTASFRGKSWSYHEKWTLMRNIDVSVVLIPWDISPEGYELWHPHNWPVTTTNHLPPHLANYLGHQRVSVFF